MITEVRVPTSDELPLPPEYESERSKWRYYGIDWEDVTQAPYTEMGGPYPSVDVIRAGNAISAVTDFIQEEGMIRAMHFVRNRQYSYRAGFVNLTIPFGQLSSAVGMNVSFVVAFPIPGNTLPPAEYFYNYISDVNYSAYYTGEERITSYERVEVKSPNQPLKVDLKSFDTGPGVGSNYSEISLYDQRHNQSIFPVNYQEDMGVGSSSASGSLTIYSSYDFHTVHPFPVEKETPCSLYLRDEYTYGLRESDTSRLTKTIFEGGDESLYATPAIRGICVLWEPFTKAQEGAFWHPNRTIYRAANSVAGVVVTRQMPGAGVETLVTIPGTRNPSIWQQLRGKQRTGTFVLLARHSTDQWRIYQSSDGGNTWDLMGTPFESTNIDYMTGCHTRDGAAVVAVIKGSPNKLVFKRTTDVTNWPPDADALASPIRTDVANADVTLCLAADGADDFLVVTAAGCYESKDGGKQWP